MSTSASGLRVTSQAQRKSLDAIGSVCLCRHRNIIDSICSEMTNCSIDEKRLRRCLNRNYFLGEGVEEILFLGRLWTHLGAAAYVTMHSRKTIAIKQWCLLVLRWRPWRHFTRKSAATWWMNTKRLPAPKQRRSASSWSIVGLHLHLLDWYK